MKKMRYWRAITRRKREQKSRDSSQHCLSYVEPPENAWSGSKRGYSQEEARELALKPIPEERNKKLNKQKEGKKPKRPHSDGSTPEAHQRKKTRNEGNQGEHKEQSGQPQKPSYKQAVAGIRVGVLHSNFPETLLTTEQMEKIQSFILEAIVEEQEGPYSPRFYGINRRQGVLIFTCENTETAEWLKGKQDSLKPWEEASLRIVPEEEIPRARIATVYLPDSILDTTEKITKLLKGQNKELSVGEWNVLRRSDEGKGDLLSKDHPSRLEEEKGTKSPSNPKEETGMDHLGKVGKRLLFGNVEGGVGVSGECFK
ncbi:uncharacterized protein LOC124370116 [Homalodisca vitripennis]|uniref:uncharacterized protein LOC124370116 n=1 Tax=Homalodisca vitripennis TaxID=197043 RepID=UPI001EEA8C8F|nr:uncharacterized protein LOC124370116 [Homalodisca vitripennis]